MELSDIVISKSIFQGHSVGRGGAVYSFKSTLFLSGNVFSNNTAWYFGGAMCILEYTLLQMVFQIMLQHLEEELCIVTNASFLSMETAHLNTKSQTMIVKVESDCIR